MESNTRHILGKWKQVFGYVTAGGDPVFECGQCGGTRHVYGIEHLYNRKKFCDQCGAVNTYPWEKDCYPVDEEDI